MVGLWDTVETLGLPGRTDDPDNRNPNYSDQICNMDKVAHALSLFDNRAGAYSPKLMTRRKLVADCDDPSDTLFDKVEEVWFAGDHSQIGGTEPLGYASGVSMNWMLDQARHIGVGGQPIFPKKAAVYEDRSDFVKDAQGQSPLFRLFPRRLREIRCYYEKSPEPDWRRDEPSTWEYSSAEHEVKVHRSVEERLTAGTVTRLNREDRTDGETRDGLTPKVQNALISGLSDPANTTSGCLPVKVTWVGTAKGP